MTNRIQNVGEPAGNFLLLDESRVSWAGNRYGIAQDYLNFGAAFHLHFTCAERLQVGDWNHSDLCVSLQFDPMVPALLHYPDLRTADSYFPVGPSNLYPRTTDYLGDNRQSTMFCGVVEIIEGMEHSGGRLVTAPLVELKPLQLCQDPGISDLRPNEISWLLSRRRVIPPQRELCFADVCTEMSIDEYELCCEIIKARSKTVKKVADYKGDCVGDGLRFCGDYGVHTTFNRVVIIYLGAENGHVWASLSVPQDFGLQSAQMLFGPRHHAPPVV